VGSTVAEYIMMGMEQRKAYLIEVLNNEMGKRPSLISICCGVPVKEFEWDNDKHFVCQKCEKDCLTIEEDTRNFKLILKLVEQLRLEDESIVEFLAKLGFVNKGEGEPQINKTTNYNLVLNVEDKELMKSAEELDPRGRERLRKDIENRLIGSKPNGQPE
jgi:hypothetical protein